MGYGLKSFWNCINQNRSKLLMSLMVNDTWELPLGQLPRYWRIITFELVYSSAE
ncbi:hypothetical protein PAESOLCIP111_03928 [Paenibacillus solanacearum]|uniref:Uncharacterized protein n=1 Tax=Paenibacillus solanacearum TaxID=2048548 RepID=A0A916K3D8_9BACL|nr:hypothetical protein PAESOLCIP111_03928 [Paenibacillus solanacearum]